MPTTARAYPNDLAEMVRWIAGELPAGGRVLEIGCGDGAIVERLASDGVDVVGVDPGGVESERVRTIRFEDLDDGPFDVVFASVSLHHLPDPAATTAALRRVTKPGSVLLVREFDRELLDHRPTLEWWFRQHQARAATVNTESMATYDEFVEKWRHQMEHHVLPWPTVRAALTGAGFVTESEAAAPYLFRWELDEAVRPLEESLIAQGRIRCVGIRWQGRRTG